MPHVVHEDGIERIQLLGRSWKPLLDETLGCRNICMGVSYFPPRAHAPGHIHEGEEEVVYVVRGYGRVHVGDSIEEIKPGSAIYIPAGVEHSVENTGDEEITLVFAFSPPVISGNYPDILHED